MRKEYYQSSITAYDTRDPAIDVNRLSTLVARQLVPLLRFSLNLDNEVQLMQAEMLGELQDDEMYGCVRATHSDVSKAVKELAANNMIILGKYNNIFMNPHWWWAGDPDRKQAARDKWDKIKDGTFGGKVWQSPPHS